MSKYIVFFSLLLLGFNGLNAQDEARGSRLYASQAVSGAFVFTQDDKFTNLPGWVNGFTNQTNLFSIELGLDEDKHVLYYTPFKIVVRFDVTITDAALSSTVLTNQELDIDYNPAEQTRYKDKAQLSYPNIYKAKVSNIRFYKCNQGTPNANCTTAYNGTDVYLEAEISTERLYNFSTTYVIPSLAIQDSVTSKKELKISWPFVTGATEYELDYAYVDDYDVSAGTYLAGTALSYNLEHDATRIVTNENVYYIPLTYEHGYIVYRLRPVGRTTQNARIEGAWAGSAASGLLVNAGNTNLYEAIPATALNEAMLWAGSKTFAEKGRTGAGMSYKDALGLTRQSVAKLNTESKAIVEGTLYDFYMRPSIQLLPSPVSGQHLGYRNQLNMYKSSPSASPQLFNKMVFENNATNSICSPSAFTLDPVSSLGAARYYSTSNPDKDKYQGYLPDAAGLPYSQIKYKDDGQNRVIRQTLPGTAHFLGSNHDLRFFYAKPTQVELDRLFGSEAGRAMYHFKTVAADANGQLSATYTDMYGRAIATSLIGKQPLNVDALPNQTGTLVLTEHMDAAPTNFEDPVNRCKEVNTQVFVSAPGTEGYVYATTLGSFVSPCAANVCYECVYDVELSIKDECGTEIFDHDGSNLTAPGFSASIGKQPPYVAATCGSGPTSTLIAGASLSVPVMITFPKTGVYTIHKKICVSQAPISDYTTDFITNGCNDKKCDILDSLIQQTDFSGCNVGSNCQSCMEQVASYTASAANSPTANVSLPDPNGNPGDPVIVYTPTLTPQQISQALQNCQLLCPPKTFCEKINRQMEMDFYPGTGQYAATSSSDPKWNYSIFNSANSLPNAITWQTPTNYQNALGGPDFVQLSGVNVSPQSLNAADFQLYFKRSWAKAFMNNHPEACKLYFYCTLLGASLQYDEAMKNITHYDSACVTGYLKPLAYSPMSNYAPANCNTSTPDPIIALSSYSGFSALISGFTAAISGNFHGSGFDLYRFTALQFDSGVGTNANTGNFIGASSCSADLEWRKYQSLYLARKKVLYNQLLTAYLANPSAFGFTRPCNSTPAGSGFTSSFPNLNDTIDHYLGPGMANTLATLQNVPTNLSTNASASSSYTSTASNFTATLNSNNNSTVTTQCATSCSSYSGVWHANLNSGCMAYHNASSTVQQQILSALEQVCLKGCDQNTSMLGASTASPGLYYTLPGTSVNVSTFQQILNHYLGAGTCNAQLITQPAPYPAGSGGAGNGLSLTSCKCDQILQNDKDFVTMQASNTLPAGVVFPWQLFRKTHGFDLAEYNYLKCFCSAAAGGSWAPGHVWTNAQQNALSTYTVPVDPKLDCPNCLNCTDVSSIINSFSSFPGVSSYASVLQAFEQDSVVQVNIMASLNASFGAHAQQLYVDLYEDCASFNSSGSTAQTFSNTISAKALDFFRYLNKNLVQGKLLDKDHVVKLCTDDKYYLSGLYSGVLPNVPQRFYTQSVSGSSLNLSIHNGAPAPVVYLDATLVLPAGYSGNWSTLSSLHNFRAYCPSPVSSGAQYYFKVDATDNVFNVITLTGKINNAAFAIAQLSSGSTPVPSWCPPVSQGAVNTCAITQINSALTQAEALFQQQLASLQAQFTEAYEAHCYNSLNETFFRQYRGGDEYNFTLYYYDEAGNLNRTVPPKAVDAGLLSTLTTSLPATPLTYPAYSNASGVAKQYVNEYKYGTFNQPLSESSIDGGTTQFVYDEYGRLIASQNAKQAATGHVYSYSLYDAIGRLTEVGEATLSQALPNLYYYGLFTGLVTSGSTVRKQVTRTYYDESALNNGTAITPQQAADIALQLQNGQQEHLRNRVAFVTYADTYSNLASDFDYATFYNYDDHGNVKELLQYTRGLSSFSVSGITYAAYKHVSYDYELVSGNVKSANYQSGQADHFVHRYYYDSDNRLKEVYSSKDDLNYDRDAKYYYYEHGPLARIERADKQVQGSDYLYTLHGWIKGLNSQLMQPGSDAGKDGAKGNAYMSSYTDIHRYFARDAMALGLNYYSGTSSDYTAIKPFNATSDMNPVISTANLNSNAGPFYLDVNGAGDGASLYNGNISSMVSGFIDKDPLNAHVNNSPNIQLTGYRYDQLQRLTRQKAYRGLNAAMNQWYTPTASNYDDSYKVTLSYDLNGNIKTLFRNGASNSIVGGSQLAMDHLTYTYYESLSNGGIVANNSYNSNKLACVQDAVGSGNYGTDIDTYLGCSEQNRRYTYDEIGNLASDKGDYIAQIEWTVDRKVKRIIRDSVGMQSAGVTKPDIEYSYNAMRQRVVKIVKPRDAVSKQLKGSLYWQYTYYTYDAGGNVLATYSRSTSPINGSSTQYADKVSLSEHPVYGSGRLAIARPSTTLATWTQTFTVCGGDISNCRIPGPGVSVPPAINTYGYKRSRELGYKEFELSNHLGNVITTVSDRKLQLRNCPEVSIEDIGFENEDGDIQRLQYVNAEAGIRNGVLELTLHAPQSMVYGEYTATEGGYYYWSTEVSGLTTNGGEVYAKAYPYNSTSGLTGAAQSVKQLMGDGIVSLDYRGGSGYDRVRFVIELWSGSSDATLHVDNWRVGSSPWAYVNPLPTGGPDLLAPGCNTVGNTFGGYFPDVLMHTDYYAGGQAMPGRTWNGSPDKYRYTHNGHEREDELFEGAQSAEYWMYDSRIIRRWERDPITYPWQSPYAAFNNNPILFADPRGLKGDDKGKKGGDLKNGTQKVDAQVYPSGWDKLAAATPEQREAFFNEMRMESKQIKSVSTSNGPGVGSELKNGPVEAEAPLPVLRENTIAMFVGSMDLLSASVSNSQNRAHFVDLRPQSYVNMSDAYNYLNRGGFSVTYGFFNFSSSGDFGLDHEGNALTSNVDNLSITGGEFKDIAYNGHGLEYTIGGDNFKSGWKKNIAWKFGYSNDKNLYLEKFIWANQAGITTGTLTNSFLVTEKSARIVIGAYHNSVHMKSIFTSTNGAAQILNEGTKEVRGFIVGGEDGLFQFEASVPFKGN